MPSNSAKTTITAPTVRNVVFALYPGMKLLDIAGALQAFQDARSRTDHALYRPIVASMDGATTKTDTVVSITCEQLSLWSKRSIDTLIVPGGTGAVTAAKDATFLALIRQMADNARRVGSVCTGAFILAACGLLHGRRAVTHWNSCVQLAESYPDVEVETEPIFIQDGRIWTSAGVTAGIDMALAMVAEDIGRPGALKLARALVCYMVRPGGQSQFSETLNRQTADASGRFDALHSWIQDNLDSDLRVERLAAYSGMSPRNFARLYVATTGQTPAKTVEAMRVVSARRVLEESGENISAIARQCGFGDDERMRRAFLRLLHVAPQDYRARFRSSVDYECEPARRGSKSQKPTKSAGTPASI